MKREQIGREIHMAIENECLGLKVFKDDPRLIDEVKYNGCETYKGKLSHLGTVHVYTELITKSSFQITGVPTVHEVRRKIMEMRERFKAEEGGV